MVSEKLRVLFKCKVDSFGYDFTRHVGRYYQWSCVTLMLLSILAPVVRCRDVPQYQREGRSSRHTNSRFSCCCSFNLDYVLLLGDGGARIRPETLPRRKPVRGFQFSSFIKKTNNTTKPINPLEF
jgi:hypothetical protein